MRGILARIVPAVAGFTIGRVTEGARDLIIGLACLMAVWLAGLFVGLEE